MKSLRRGSPSSVFSQAIVSMLGIISLAGAEALLSEGKDKGRKRESCVV